MKQPTEQEMQAAMSAKVAIIAEVERRYYDKKREINGDHYEEAKGS